MIPFLQQHQINQTSLNQETRKIETKIKTKTNRIPSQNRYANGYRWCGRCGEWFKMKDEDMDKAKRCPWCNYMLRKDALLKSQRRPKECARH